MEHEMNIIEQLDLADKSATPAPWQEKPENKHLTVLMRNHIGSLIALAKACSEMDPQYLSDNAREALEALQK
jgi:hypothetical protein